MKSVIEDVFYGSPNDRIISFKLSDDVEVKGLLSNMGNTIKVKPMFWKEGDPVENHVPVEVDGYSVPFFLPYGTEVEIDEAPLGSENRPHVFNWEDYDPKKHLNQFCRITGKDGVVRSGKLAGYNTRHSRVQSYGSPGIHFFVEFDFQNGDVLVINSTMVKAG